MTGLIWVRDAHCYASNWPDAITWSNNLASGKCGLNDGSTAGQWRLPNRMELMSLINRQEVDSSIWLNTPNGPFSNVQPYLYWSSSSYTDSTYSKYLGSYSSWIVDMRDGTVSDLSKGDGSYVWPVRGGQSGWLGSLGISPASKSYGSVVINSTSAYQTFTLTNSGNASLSLSSITLVGGDSDQFTLSTDSCGYAPTLAPAASCTISAAFTPTSTGVKETTLIIKSTDQTSQKAVKLTGTGELSLFVIGSSVVGGHGSISCNSPVSQGNGSICTIIPSSGYHLATLTDNAVDKLSSVVTNKYNISNITADHTISVSFAFNTVSTPCAITTSATKVSVTSSTLNGMVTDNYAAPTITFQYGLDTDYGRSANGGYLAVGSGASPVSAVVNDLTPDTIYHYRVVAQNSAGITYGNDMTFKTQLPLQINNGDVYTTSVKVTLSMIYKPAPAKMQFFYNNKTWTKPEPFAATKNITLPSGDGLKTVQVIFYDSQGKASALYSASIILDTKLPVGSIAINNGAAITASRDVTLTLAACDINGVTGMQFSEAGRSWWNAVEPYATTKTYTILSAGDGLKTVMVRYQSVSGKFSAVTKETITLNSGWQPPTVGSSINVASAKLADPVGYTTATGVVVSLSPPQGMAYMSFSIDGMKWTSWALAATSKKLSVPDGDGLKTVYARFASSNVVPPANISITYSGSITLDTKAPEGSFQINAGAYSTTNHDVTLTLAAEDLNGVTQMLLTYDPAVTPQWEKFADSKTITLPAGTGSKKVSVKYMDAAGKISAAYAATIVVK